MTNILLIRIQTKINMVFWQYAESFSWNINTRRVRNF